MTDSVRPSAVLSPALRDEILQIVMEAISKAGGNGNRGKLLEPEELAAKLNVPKSWVYEQSRQGNIPTHRIGRYIRFDLEEVLASQKKS